MNGALSTFRILDLSSYIAGPFCAKLFGDYGADVIKVEPRDVGDVARTVGPFFKDDPHPEKSLLFFYLNCNKRGVTLNLESSAGRKVFLKLVKESDALIETFPPGYLNSIGLGYESLEEVNPGLVMTSISPFGQTGPYSRYKGSHLIYEGMGGIMYTSGAYDREPLAHGHPQSYYIGGITAAYTTSAALYARNRMGKGQHIDVSLTEVAAAHHTGPTNRFAYTGAIERRAPKHEPGSPKSGPHMEGIVPVKDGYVGATFQRGAATRAPLSDYLRLLGADKEADPSFVTPSFQGAIPQHVDDLVLSVLKEWKKLDYFNTVAAGSWVAAMLQTSEDLVNSEQLHHRGFYAEVKHPVMGTVKIPGEVYRMPACPYKLRFPAPLLGQHNTEVYCSELGYSREETVLLRQQGAI
jgi:crotonobetainyl-CoA:carnitine CoA-transferase CaiB-like acyl-CoA transferase